MKPTRPTRRTQVDDEGPLRELAVALHDGTLVTLLRGGGLTRHTADALLEQGSSRDLHDMLEHHLRPRGKVLPFRPKRAS